MTIRRQQVTKTSDGQIAAEASDLRIRGWWPRVIAIPSRTGRLVPFLLDRVVADPVEREELFAEYRSPIGVRLTVFND